jgi:hypothetical protein
MKEAYYRSIPCYYDDDTHELHGRNWFYNILLDVTLWFDVEILQIEEFPIWIDEADLVDEEDEQNKENAD